MGKGSAPKTPDYTAAAKATAQGNLDTARFTAGFNRVNQTGPTGSSTWGLREGADPNNAQAGDYTLNTSVDPALMQTYEQMLSQAGQSTDQVQDAYYRRAAGRYDERFGQDEAALRSRLANSGFAPGSEGYNRELASFNENKNDAYRDATDSSILAGSQEQTAAINRLLGIMGGINGAVPGQQTPGMGQVAGADLMGALQSQNQADMARYQQQSNNFNSVLGTGGTLAAVYMM